jgi:hypothetical protein
LDCCVRPKSRVFKGKFMLEVKIAEASIGSIEDLIVLFPNFDEYPFSKYPPSTIYFSPSTFMFSATKLVGAWNKFAL